MSQLEFRFSELLQEIQTLRSMAAPFLDADRSPLDEFESSLENIGSSAPDRQHRWVLRRQWTRVSAGEYEAGSRRGEAKVIGCVSGNWDVTPLGQASKKAKGVANRLMRFSGIASTRVEIFTEDRATRLSMWRVELGDSSAPGCYFHVQVLGEHPDPPFPKSVSVPRLPSLFVTPLAATEFLFGELFQDDWERTARSDTDDVQRWSNLQRERFKRLLLHHQSAVVGSTGSPWVALKRDKPPPALFSR